ncbi:helix-turn-helix domain-containing protein [Frankia sp. AiPs1]|uniref:ArsR/SmtB family transcription factor n=1 Tax=Frankia sp. AiPs1 TaxID=573493 RepID=UPI002044ACDC|nr:metalloregulator ArsR/SmtB family transcription factor [Frankia sp. AiPs1]MCM3920237.1 helix-turn-helix domain-containing protein [Frankia sp. AiPs1]
MRRVVHPPADQITLATVLSALGDPIRLEIVKVLGDGQEHLQPDFVVPVGQSTLSHHMKTLRDAGVVLSRPEGTRCFVSLRPELEQKFPGLLDAVLRSTRPSAVERARADGGERRA